MRSTSKPSSRSPNSTTRSTRSMRWCRRTSPKWKKTDAPRKGAHPHSFAVGRQLLLGRRFGLVRHDVLLDLAVDRCGHDLLLHQVILGVVRAAGDDLVGGRVAYAFPRDQLLL